MDQLKHFNKFTGGKKMDARVPYSWQCKQIVNKPRRYPVKQVKNRPDYTNSGNYDESMYV